MTQITMTQITNFDYVFLIDASGSMANVDPGQKVTRFERAKESVIGLVSELGAVDEDGIDVITFGGESIIHTAGVKTPADVQSAFNRRVAGGTPTAEALAKAFEIAGKSDKPDFVVVITDGEPNNRQAVKDVIIKQANSQNADGDLTVLFIQIGDDAAAGQFLTQLDDDLVGAKFDIVDTMTQAKADSYSTLAALIEDAING